MLPKEVLAAFGNPKKTSPGVFQQKGFFHVESSPTQSIVKNALSTAGKQLLLFVFGKAEFPCKGVDRFANAVFSVIGAESQKGEHEALKIRYGHRAFLYSSGIW